ncbi:hypothetical protein [Fodinibius sp.]|uniref:hypothetical protein n=1 Tax=Fodinibius sp. TaxID=1872440 RepID=UPI002ACE3787|nr:hypothetical protein [Fodinibius sp.]MDZ7660525.1 hypothetical protein [Fodinibius sp.]
MKLPIKHFTLILIAFSISAGSAFAQQFTRDLQYFRYSDQRGLNQFEAPFETDFKFDGLKIRIGGANTIQFQGLRNDNAAGSLTDLESNFNLATSNLDLDAVLANGVRMHLRTYLSSQNHNEAYVKGGYLQIDRLDFIQEGLFDGMMDKVRFKVGHMELNYGDNHFRRTDNAQAIYNPFVGNYIMDSFTTEVAGEVYYFNEGLLAMVGISNGKLNQSVTDADGNGFKTKPSVYGKLGYDKQVNEDLRVRLTGSILNITQSASIYLYSGDRAGSRYYDVITPGNFRAGRFSPSFTPGFGQPAAPGEMTALMINPFIKFQGLEFYGVFENTSGKLKSAPDRRTFNQYGAELLYRFGTNEDIYIGGRYNLVDGKTTNGDIEIDRFNIGGGWFLTKNVLAKLEYVTQNYSGDGYAGSPYEGAEFNGVMIEAVISF